MVAAPGDGIPPAAQSFEEVERVTFVFLTLTRSSRGFLVTLALQHSR